jgi:hypothetical protein
MASFVAVVLCSTVVLATPPGSGSSIAAASGPSARYEPLTPFRLADTREQPCGCTRRDATTITVDVAEQVGRDDIVAAAVTVTALATSRLGHVTVYPEGTSLPDTATLNTRPDRNVSNSTIVGLGSSGELAIFQLVPGQLVVDITGVFVAAGTAAEGRFVPVVPRRLADTRAPGAFEGILAADGELTVPIPDGVPPDATALAVNITSVGVAAPGYLSVRPAGTPYADTSIMTMNASGQAVAATTLATLSPDGFTVRSKSGGHVIVDFSGWFTGASADESSEGLFVPVPPRRLHDTRSTAPRVWPEGTVEVPIDLPDAAAIVSNLTATQSDRGGFVTAYPARTALPTVSALNPAFYQHTVANLSIVPVSTAGVAYYSMAGVDVVVDMTGYFQGVPVAANLPPAPNSHRASRVLMVGDSTLAGLAVFTRSQRAFVGFDPVLDPASCRRLLRPSCLSDTTGLIPNTAVEAIRDTPGTVDVVVMKTGYNDWFSDFPKEFDAVVQMSRLKGAHTIIWMTYNEAVPRNNARRAYQENNIDLRWLVTLPQYSDVILADWQRYSDGRPDWFYDGTHTTPSGSYAIADYISRWMAAVEHRPCPKPQTVGGPIAPRCPVPDLTGPVPDPVALYP